MLMLILINLIVIASATILARYIFKFSALCDYLLAIFILFFAQIVLVGLFLGIIGQLYFLNVFIAHLFILLITSLIYFRKEMPVFVKPNIEPFMNSNLLLFAISIFLCFFLVKTFYNLINPPLAADSWQYHLAFPATWIKNGCLNNPIFLFASNFMTNPGSLETSSLSYYPINAQLFFTWLMLPLKSAFLADSGNAPFYIIGIIAVYSILRKYNVHRVVALLSGFLWVLIPNIFKQLKTGSLIDVICAVLFLLVFATLLLLKLNFTFKNAILFGISIGLFAGTKVINLVWLAAFIPIIFYVLYRGIKTNKFSLGKTLVFLATITLMIILFGGFIYIKNYVFTGNPLFPVDVKIFGKTLFKGLLDNNAYKTQIAQGDRFNLMKVLFSEGLGVQFLALILPGTFLPVVFYKYLKTKVRPLGEYLLLFATPLIMLILYGVFINIFTARYFFVYLTLGLLNGVILITKLPRGDRYFAFASFLSIFTASFVLANRFELILSLLLSLLLFIVFGIYKKQIPMFYKSKNFSKAALLILLLGCLSLAYLNNKYDQDEFERYPLIFIKKEAWQADIGKSWEWLNEQTREGARVAYAGRAEFYPLFGAKLKNEVRYVSINKQEANPYNRLDGLWRQIKDFAAWRENLKKERIEYLFVALPFFENRESDDPTKFPIEDEWAAAHSKDFQLLFSNSLAHIYKVHF